MGSPTHWRSSHGTGAASSAAPAREGGDTAGGLDPVIDVLDHPALVVEAEHRGPRQGQFPFILDPARPPLDRGPVACGDRCAEPALDRVLHGELAPRVAERGTEFWIPHRVGA